MDPSCSSRTMERRNDSGKVAICKQVISSLFALILGLLFCLPLTTLVYHTYQAVAESTTFCTLWIDVPGRVAIFLTCYYTGSMCGFFPLPQRYRLNVSLEPFMVYRLESWTRLFRNVFFPTPSFSSINRLQRNAVFVRDISETPLLQENDQEPFDDCSPIRQRSNPVGITYPESYVAPVFVSRRESPPSNASPEIVKGSNGSLTSITSSASGVIFPMMVKPSKSHYLPNSSNRESSSESPDGRNAVSSKYRKKYTEAKWIGKSANVLLPVPDNHSGAVANDKGETALKLRNTETELDFPKIRDRNRQPGEAMANEERVTSPKCRNTETQLNFPRFPWCYLRHPRGVPVGANKLHKRNLEREKHEIDIYLSRQKRQVDVERLTRSLLTSLRNEGVTETQLRRSRQNINLITKNSFHAKSSSVVAANYSGEQTRKGRTAESFINKKDVDHATNGSRPLFSPNRTQRLQVESTGRDQATNRRRLLPTQRFRRKVRLHPEIQIKSVKTDFTLETRGADFSGSTTVLEVGLSNFPEFKQDTERSGLLGPVTEEMPKESFKRLQIGDLKSRPFRIGRSTQSTAGVSAAFKLNQSMKTEIQTTDANVQDTAASNISSEADVATPTNQCRDERDSEK